jgi:DNA polymerase
LTEHEDPRPELESVAQQVRALLEWLADTGAEGIPRRVGERSRDAEPAAPERVAASRPSVERPAAPVAVAAPAAGQVYSDLSAEERVQRLAELEQQVRSCTRCPLHQHRTQAVFARGSPHAQLAFVGEGPGADEDAQGVPFVGAAGQLLDRMIAAMGYDRDEVYVCNIVKCRPPRNRKPTVEEMQTCEPYLREQLALVDPEALIALGATAAQGLLGWYDAGPRGPGITRLRGHWKVYQARTPLMPTFHPAYLLRSPEKKRDVWNDLQMVMQRLGRKPPAPARGRRER